MKLKVVVYCISFLILASCGSKKKVVENKKNSGVILNEPIPKELPSVNEKKLTKELANNNPKLNKATLAYIEEYASIAVNEMHSHKIPASITLAQGILESGNGKSYLASKSNNHFGIKCHTGWQGERVYHDDDEDQECFRKYQYVANSYKDHSAFLTQRKRYSFLFNYKATDYKKWAKGLKKAGYATDKKYPNKLIHIIERYQLYKFDNVKNSNTEKESPVKIEKPGYTIGNYYEVKKGDTLYSISKKFKTTVDVLKELNGLKDNAISIGQHLLTK